MIPEPTPPLYAGDRIRWGYVKKYLPRSEGGNILDAGCGQGEFKSLCEYKGYKYFGIDTDERCEFDKGDLCALPYKDRMFEAIICVDVLEHIQDDIKAVRELFRVLKSDGILLVHVPNIFQKHILIEPEEQDDHVRRGYTPITLRSLFVPEFKTYRCYPTFDHIESVCWDITYAGIHNLPVNTLSLLDKEKWDEWKNYGWIAICKTGD